MSFDRNYSVVIVCNSLSFCYLTDKSVAVL